MSARQAIHPLAVAPHVTSRTAVILLHGLCSTPDELRPVEAALRALHYQVHPLPIEGYSFDMQSRVQQAGPWRGWIDAIERTVDALRLSADRVLLVGISAGASLALAAAIRCGGRVDGLVLMSTSLRVDGWSIPHSHFLLPLALYTPLGRFWTYRERPPYGVKNERVRLWIERNLRARRISSAGSAVIGVAHLRENDRLIRHVRRRLGEVRCPQVLALHAREDEIASVANLDLLARTLRSNTLRCVVLGNSFHMITIDNDRAQVVRETVAFAAAITHGTA